MLRKRFSLLYVTLAVCCLDLMSLAATALTGPGSVPDQNPVQRGLPCSDQDQSEPLLATFEYGLYDTAGVPMALSYTVTDLGTLGGGESVARAINEAGQVVGWAENASGYQRPFLFEQGVMTDLGTLGGLEGGANDINNLGEICGWARTASNRGEAFVLRGGQMISLGAIGGNWSCAYGINDAGEIAWFSKDAAGSNHALHWADGVTTELGTLGGSQSVAWDINDSGQIVGYAMTVSERWHACLWSDGSVLDLGTFGGLESWAFKVTDTNTVVGKAQMSDGSWRAFVWNDGVMDDLGTLGGADSFARAMSVRGRIVGSSDTEDGQEHACVWDGAGLRDLNALIPADSGWELVAATHINDAGVIVGRGLVEGVQHAFLLTPVEDCNDNGVPDDEDIVGGTSVDCNTNGIPDECEDDSDGDGVIDDCDACPDSDMGDTIVIDGCDTMVTNLVLGDDGCTMADQIAQCAEDATDHGEFVCCVAHLTNEWRADGVITGRQKGRIQRCAAQADIPPGAQQTLADQCGTCRFLTINCDCGQVLLYVGSVGGVGPGLQPLQSTDADIY